MLKIDEYAKISIRSLLFIWRILPMKAVVTMNGRNNFFVWYIIKYTGAAFCQVISKVLFFSVDLLITLINHWWNGPTANLTISAIALIKAVTSIIFREPISLIVSILKSKRIEVIDWMTKYFILISLVFKDISSYFQNLTTQQKDIVFISSVIQILSHELHSKHNGGVSPTIVFIARYLLILLNT